MVVGVGVRHARRVGEGGVGGRERSFGCEERGLGGVAACLADSKWRYL